MRLRFVHSCGGLGMRLCFVQSCGEGLGMRLRFVHWWGRSGYETMLGSLVRGKAWV